MIRDTIQTTQTKVMKSGDKATLATIRLIQAAIKNRDIEARAPQSRSGVAPADDDTLVVEVLQKMVKQRRESIEMFGQGGRHELAANEEQEIGVIELFLPQQLDEDAVRDIIASIKDEVGAAGPKDMGRVMAVLKERHASDLDMSKASALVKAALA